MSRAPTATGSDLTTRFAMGMVLGAGAMAITYFGGVSVAGGWVFRIAVAASAAAMLIEWSDMHRVPRSRAYAGAALLAAFLLIAAERQFPVAEIDLAISAASFAPVWPALGAAAAGAAAAGVAARRWALFGGFLYIGVPAFALLVLEWTWFGLVAWAMAVTWATDIFAFFAGSILGGPKLAPRISPNKTWAGLAGGVAGAALFGWLVARLFDLGMPFLVIGGAMAVLSQAGDLYESRVKRRAGVKDSGTLLPGHGGLLDRLDGFLPVVVATLALLMAGYWAG